MKKFLLILLFLGALKVPKIYAQQVRKYSNEFLKIGVGAEALALGGAQTATAIGPWASYWNPAGIEAPESKVPIALMHSEYFAGLAKYDFGSVVIPMESNSMGEVNSWAGVSLIRFAVDDIPNTLQLIDPDGSINYNNVSSFSAADYAFIGSYAKNMNTTFQRKGYLKVGGNVKVIRRTVGHFANAWGFGFDLGMKMKYNRWMLGACLHDASTTFNVWNFTFTDLDKQALALTGNLIPKTSTELTLPQLNIGAAYPISFANAWCLTPVLDLAITTDGQRNVLISAKPFSIDPRVGLALDYKQRFYLRGGVGNFQKLSDDNGIVNTSFQPNLGVGIHLKNFYVDYALTNVGNVSQVLYSNVVSLQINMPKK
ncbi:MAG: hypothetical protein ORN56_05020 [Chitinophagales bacterium]|nr:hypothetical protein [Chitinophagales bacterium]